MIRYHYAGPSFSDGVIKLVGGDICVSMYRSMLRIRRIEEEIESRYKENQMKTPIHLVIGQEATSVGSCAALRKSDHIYTGHRTHGAYLAKGGDLKAMLAELYCKATGCAGSRGGSMHLFDKLVGMAGSSAICGGIVPIATGTALAAQMRQQDRVNLVFFGDGGSEEGAVWESLNFAQMMHLPVIYFCENNFYSVCSPLSKRQPAVQIFHKAQGFGLVSYQVDGVNAIEVYNAVKDAADACRQGIGPVFIEAKVYRWRAHGGAGDDSHTGYRDPLEVKEWEAHCPIESLGKALAKMGLFLNSDRAAMESEIKKEIVEAFEFAIASPLPQESDLYTHVYADLAPGGSDDPSAYSPTEVIRCPGPKH